MSKAYMYILSCADGSYYVGSTKNIEQRFNQHQEGAVAGYTAKRLPVKLVCVEEFERIDEAFQREKQVQEWSRKKKEALIATNYDKLPELSKNYKEYGVAGGASANDDMGGCNKSDVAADTGDDGNVPFDKLRTSSSDKTQDRPFDRLRARSEGRSGIRSEGGSRVRSEGRRCPNPHPLVEPVETNTGTKIPKGYKQTEVGVIPEDWEVNKIGNLISISTGNKNTQDKVANGIYPFFVRSQQVERINTFSFEGEAVLTAGDGVGTGKIFHYINGKCDFHQRVYLMYNFGKKLDGYYFYIFFSNHFYDRIMSMTAKSSVDSVRRDMITEMPIALPTKKEQTAIANALSDVDALISELEKLISKKQAIKTAAMQQLLTGRIRLPQFAPQSAASAEFDSGSQIKLDFTSSDESDSASSSVSDSTSFTPSVKPDSSPATSTSSSPLVEPVETNTDTKIPKGYKQTELGVIPEDWKVVPFKNLLSIRHGKSQKGVEAENGLYPILATGGQIGWSDNYLWNKPSVLIGRKGTINKPRFVDIPFWTVDTLFYSEIKSDVNAKFIYYKFCMVDWMQYNEASGVPSLNASTIEAVLSATPKKKEQTAIATILSDMDDEIQSLKKRLAKTRQIKQGMMQELLTGKTRLIKPKHKGDSHAC